MAELMFPNLAAAFQQGQAFGTNTRLQREGEQRQNQLRDLASRAYAAPAQERQGLVQQAVGVDPEAGLALGGQLEKREADQVARAGNVADYLLTAIDSKNPAQIQGAYNAVKPYFQSIAPAGTAIPDTVDDSIVPMLHQLKAAASGGSAANNVQSTQIGANGNIFVVTRDGRVVDTGQRAAPSTQVINQPGQVPFLVTTGRGQVGETTSIGGQPQIGASGQPYTIDPSLPPEVQADIVRMESGQPTVGFGGPAPVRTPTAGENAFAEAQARNQAELDVSERQTRLAAEREAAVVQAREGAERQAEARAALPTAIATADELTSLVDQALSHPGRATVTGLSGRIDPRNYIAGTDAADFNVLLDQIKGKAFLQAFNSLKGAGAITDREGQAARDAIARLNAYQSDEAFAAALNDFKKIISAGRAKAEQKARGASQPPAQGGWSIQRVN